MRSLVQIAALAGIVFLLIVYIYNALVRKSENVRNGWSQIDVQLKRRHDLIPNLVETVRGYADHERELFERIAALRSEAIRASTPAEAGVAEAQLSGALKTLFAVSEGYPELRANANFLALQEELASTENKIAFARQYYNDSVKEYNIAVSSFPSSIVAGIAGFGRRDMWTIDLPAERDAVSVTFPGAGS
jgi:LemA protein